MAPVDIWYRPWAFHSPNDKRAVRFNGGEIDVPSENRASVWIVTDEPESLRIDGAQNHSEPVATLRDERRVFAVPLAPKQSRGLRVETAAGKALLRFTGVPDVPTKDHDPNSGEPKLSQLGFSLRVCLAVWTGGDFSLTPQLFDAIWRTAERGEVPIDLRCQP